MTTLELTRAASTGRRLAYCIEDARGQDRVALTGVITATQAIKVGSGRAYRCVLADGTGELDMLFLGRATVAGLAEGTRCSIRGTVTTRRGRLTVWNPRYQVEVHAAEEVRPGIRSDTDATWPDISAEDLVSGPIEYA